MQPLSPWAISVLPEGLKAKECYTVFSQQTLSESFEGSSRIGDAVYIPKALLYNTDLSSAGDYAGGWFVVAKTKPFKNGVINHCESVVYRDHTLNSPSGIPQFPDTSLIDPFMIDDKQFKSGQWESSWLGDQDV